MLEFIDKPRAISVYRRDQLTRSRIPVATINKISLNVTEEATAVLSAEEAVELTDFVKLRREADELGRRMAFLRLPSYLREAVEYSNNGASEFEKRLLLQCIGEAHAQLKRSVAKREP